MSSSQAIRVRFFSFTFILLRCITIASPAMIQSTNTADPDALLCIMSHLSLLNTTGALATWTNRSTDFCRWRGVRCSRRHGPTPHVAALDLEGEGLVGQIPPCIANLSYLERIHLPVNHLSGPLPRELCQLGRLKYVNFSFNALSGAIVPEISSCPHLRVIALRNNKINGGIPAALFNSSLIKVIDIRGNNLSGSIPQFLPNSSTSLEFLALSGNSLSGEVPSSIGNLSSLAVLLASRNQLTGFMPDTLERLSSMQLLDLTYNNLLGSVPNSIYNLSLLTYLGLGNNGLVGKLPSTIGNTLPNIEKLVMSKNNFDGEIPKSLANASNLASLFLADNSFSGLIPSLGHAPNMQKIMLFQNHRLEAGDWTFLTSLTNCTQLEWLVLHGNNLQGDLPSSVGKLSGNLKILDLGSNQITGTIRSGIGDLLSLSLLYLQDNLLSGPIPASIGNLDNLFVLNLSKNRLYGKIPATVGKLEQLSELHLQENNLGGMIPEELAGCKKLLALNLSSNAFGGPIPEGIFSKLNQLSWWLDLSYNQLTHSIPDEVGSLINLGALNLSNNNIAGQIPSTIGSCLLLQELRLEGNFLDGHIPPSLAGLRGIEEMDFSRNNLSGEIPDFFELFNSLQYLNLSFNNLDGPIPTKGIFLNATAIISLEGNPNMCTISAMPQFPPCSARSFERSNKHIVQLLVVILPCLAIPLLFLLFMTRRSSKDSCTVSNSSIEFKTLSYNDLSRATNGFSSENLIGSGKFGVVYKGALLSLEVGQHVAVKVFKLDEFGASNSFLSECRALRNIRHRNLVKVITACSTSDPLGNEFKALILEYMANGTLEDHLHSKYHQYGYLCLGARMGVAEEIAYVLDYLHNWSVPPLIHCDLKPSNILFDDSNVAHVGDFGIAKFVHGFSSSGIHEEDSTSFIGPRGSMGYIAPEYGMGSRISPEGDEYSYGIVLLEMLTGKRPTDDIFKDGFTLQKYVSEAIPQIGEILDPDLIMEIERNDISRIHVQEPHDNLAIRGCILQLLNIALLCSAEIPKHRPSIQDVCSEVVAVRERYLSFSHDRR